MTKQEFMKYTGSLQQLAYVRPMHYMEGRAKGMRAYEVKCGNLSFHVMADKCLDISDFSYKGMNLTFLSKPGLTGRAHYDTNGEEARRSIMGGLFFTCGLENICAPCHIEGYVQLRRSMFHLMCILKEIYIHYGFREKCVRLNYLVKIWF